MPAARRRPRRRFDAIGIRAIPAPQTVAQEPNPSSRDRSAVLDSPALAGRLPPTRLPTPRSLSLTATSGVSKDATDRRLLARSAPSLVRRAGTRDAISISRMPCRKKAGRQPVISAVAASSAPGREKARRPRPDENRSSVPRARRNDAFRGGGGDRRDAGVSRPPVPPRARGASRARLGDDASDARTSRGVVFRRRVFRRSERAARGGRLGRDGPVRRRRGPVRRRPGHPARATRAFETGGGAAETRARRKRRKRTALDDDAAAAIEKRDALVGPTSATAAVHRRRAPASGRGRRRRGASTTSGRSKPRSTRSTSSS